MQATTAFTNYKQSTTTAFGHRSPSTDLVIQKCIKYTDMKMPLNTSMNPHKLRFY